ncbi:MAG: di-heme oxidoredictase family protein [Pseudomonadota bacterium]
MSEPRRARLRPTMIGVVALAAASLAGFPILNLTASDRASADASQPSANRQAMSGDPRLPGGRATARLKRFNRNAFSAPSGNLSFSRLLDFKIGNAIFRKLWVSSPASTASSDGLGPLYNARSCQRCHLKDGRGHPPAHAGDDAVSMLVRLSVPPLTEDERALLASGKVAVLPEPTYGRQLQDLAVQGHGREARVSLSYETHQVTLAEGEVVTLRKPRIALDELGYGALRDDTMMSLRVAQPMIGLGLLEAIPDADILARADPEDADGDGISGRPNRVWSNARNSLALGRFGWKAGQPTLRSQTASAFAGDMGLSSSIDDATAGDCTPRQTRCQSAPDGRDPDGRPEVRDALFDLTVFYVSNLGVPPRRNMGAPDVQAGGKLFREIGCAACHTPRHTTGAAPPRGKHLADQVIYPYTDLLLHDMGEGLADGRPEAQASGREWRTPPLWGIGLTQTVSGHTFFLHDGRARNLTEAILWHGGEAQRSRDAFAALPARDRARLLAFLGSL